MINNPFLKRQYRICQIKFYTGITIFLLVLATEIYCFQKKKFLTVFPAFSQLILWTIMIYGEYQEMNYFKSYLIINSQKQTYISDQAYFNYIYIAASVCLFCHIVFEVIMIASILSKSVNTQSTFCNRCFFFGIRNKYLQFSITLGVLFFDLYYFYSLTNMLWKKNKYQNKLKELKESEDNLEFRNDIQGNLEIQESFNEQQWLVYEDGLLKEKKVELSHDQNLNKNTLQTQNSNSRYSKVPCEICSQQIEDFNESYELSCGDKFHQVCLLSWFNKNDNCPQCLAALKSQEKSELEFLLNQSYIQAQLMS